MGENLSKRQLRSDGYNEASTLNDQLATSNLSLLPPEIIDMILKFLDRKNKMKMRLVNERYSTYPLHNP